MKETYLPRSAELTQSKPSPTLKGGDIFMPEPVVGELTKEAPKDTVKAPLYISHIPTVPESEAPAKNAFASGEVNLATTVNPEAHLRSAWDSWKQTLPLEEQKNHATNEVIKTAIDMGIAPGGNQEARKEQFEKVQKEDRQRLEKARKLLSEANLLKVANTSEQRSQLTSEEETAILESHYYGVATDIFSGKQYVALEGKDGKAAGIGNYKPEQLGVKADILKGDERKETDAIVGKEGRRILMEKEIVGVKANAVDIGPFDPASFRDTTIRNNAEDFFKRVLEGQADAEFLRGMAAEMRRLRNEPTSSPEQRDQAARLIDTVEEIRQIVEKREEQERELEVTRQGRRGRRESSSPDVAQLTEEIEKYLEGKKDQSKRTPEDIQKESDFVKRIIKELHNPKTPPVDSSRFPDDLLEAAGAFQETREMLISQIIFKAFEDKTERNDYNIDLYAGDKLKQLLESAKIHNPETYDDLFSLETSARLFHTMNGRVFAGAIEEFARIAERIDPKHFRIMNGFVGVGQVMRLYEQRYSEELAKSGAIYNYEEIKKDVEKSFRQMVSKGFMKTKYHTRATTRLEDWEIERALNIARCFSNIAYRSAEYIASGEPAKKTPNTRYGSGPLESAAKLMNHIQWVPDRFSVGASRGGPEFLQLNNEHFHKNNLEDKAKQNRKKIGFNKIEKFGGRTVDDLELADYFGIRGMYGGWRLQKAYLSKLFVPIEGKNMSLEEWFGKHGDIYEVREHVQPNHHGHRHGGEKAMNHAQDELVKRFKPLVDNMHNGLGMLLVHGSIGEEPGYKVRKMIWEKVAKTNTPLMIDYLTGLIMRDDVDIKSLEDLQFETKGAGKWNDLLFENLLDNQGNPIKNQDGSYETRQITRFAKFKEKVTAIHQKNVLIAAGKDISGIVLEELTPQEKELEKRIREEGLKLAPHLADIIFAYTPFMNDVPFEDFDYEAPGQESYKRLMGDYGDFSKAQHAYDGIQDHPGGYKIDKMLEQLKNMEAGMSGPPGPEDGMRRMTPVIMAVTDYYETEGEGVMLTERLEKIEEETKRRVKYVEDQYEQRIKSAKNADEKWRLERERDKMIARIKIEGKPEKREKRYGSFFRKQMLWRIIKQATEHATSGSETTGSIEADSLDEGAMRAFLEKLNMMGVITHAQMQRIRKKKRLTMGWLLGAIVRDFFPLIVAAGITAIAAEASNEVLGGQGAGAASSHH